MHCCPQIATTTLEEVVEMRNDIHKIEVSLKQLHQMFLDMAVLVAEQGEMINDIRDNVGKYAHRTRDCNTHPHTPQGFQLRIRRNKACEEGKGVPDQEPEVCYPLCFLVVMSHASTHAHTHTHTPRNTGECA